RAAVPVVTNKVAGRRPAVIEVVNPRGPELALATAPVTAVVIERLVVANPLGEVVAGFVAGAVDPARLEQQRTELVARDEVEVECALVGRHLFGADTVRAGTLVEGLAIDPAPLIKERGIQAEGAHPPPRVDADRVAILMERGVACRGRVVRSAPRRRRIERAPGATGVGQVSPGSPVRLTVGVEPGIQGLEVQPLERRELGAEDQSIVLAAPCLE